MSRIKGRLSIGADYARPVNLVRPSAKALPVHHTATVDETWDGPAAVAAMPAEESVLKACHAWQDSADGADPNAKSSYKFPHHKTKGGPANVSACRNGLARLPNADIPDGDRAGVKAHLQAHLDDFNAKSDSSDTESAAEPAEDVARRAILSSAALAGQGDPAPWWEISNAKGDGDQPAQVHLMEPIGGWFGMDAAEFCQQLRDITADKIDMHVNSPGGDVFDGLAIMNTIAQHPAEVTAYVDGIAASAASFLIQACDRIVMGRQSKMMIHDASGLCIGNAADMLEMADLLDTLSNDIADVYAEASGKPRAQWRTAMKAETWYGAQEAVDAGLADECVPARAPRKAEDSARSQPVDEPVDEIVDETEPSGVGNEIDDLDADTLAAELRESFSLLKGDYPAADMAEEFRIALGIVANDMPAPRESSLDGEDLDDEAEDEHDEQDQDRSDLVVDPTDFYNSLREALIR